MKFNRSDLASTIRAAVTSAATTGTARYVYSTYNGFVIETSRPPMQSYVLVYPDGNTVKVPLTFAGQSV